MASIKEIYFRSRCLINKGLSQILGNGKKIIITAGLWMEDSTLIDESNLNMRIQITKTAKVSDFIENKKTQNKQKLSQMLPNQIMNTISGMPLPRNEIEDKFGSLL